MRVKFAYAVSIAAAVAMLTACGKKQDGEAGAGASAATAAAAPASEATIVKIGHAAPLTGVLRILARTMKTARVWRSRKSIHTV